RRALERHALNGVWTRAPRCRHCGVMTITELGAEHSARLQLLRPGQQGGRDNDPHNHTLACAACARRRRAETPNLTWFRIHDWRHHWASWFIMRGGRETELMELGGWKDSRMVRRYVRLGVEHLRKAVNQL